MMQIRYLKGVNKCLDISGVSLANGAALQIWDCLPNQPNQMFSLVNKGDGTFDIRPSHSNKCLDVTGLSTVSGAGLQQWVSWSVS